MKKNKLNGKTGEELAMMFRSREDWSGLTVEEFKFALEWALKESTYSKLSEEEWNKISSKYEGNIDYAIYTMCYFDPLENQDWSIKEKVNSILNNTFNSTSKRNAIVGYKCTYMFEYINSIELHRLKSMIEINKNLCINTIVDYYLTNLIYIDEVKANPGVQFEYHQIEDEPDTRIKSLEDLRNKIVYAYNRDNQIDLYKNIFYAMTHFSGSTYRGVHKAVMFLFNIRDYSIFRDIFYKELPNIIKNRGVIPIGNVTI